MEEEVKDYEIYPFRIKDCALIAIATGIKVQNLRELRDKLSVVHVDSIYYHFWGGLLIARFEEPEYNNDFASWVHHQLRDQTLAERLAMIDPCKFSDLEDLRRELLEVIEERLDEIEYIAFSKPDKQFHFIRSQIVVFDTYRKIEDPKDLAIAVPSMPLGSIFYHFIDARRRTDDRIDDFRAWLFGFGDKYKDLCEELAHIDPYFTTLHELRNKLSTLFENYFHKG